MSLCSEIEDFVDLTEDESLDEVHATLCYFTHDAHQEDTLPLKCDALTYMYVPCNNRPVGMVLFTLKQKSSKGNWLIFSHADIGLPLCLSPHVLSWVMQTRNYL